MSSLGSTCIHYWFHGVLSEFHYWLIGYSKMFIIGSIGSFIVPWGPFRISYWKLINLSILFYSRNIFIEIY